MAAYPRAVMRMILIHCHANANDSHLHLAGTRYGTQARVIPIRI